MSAIDKQLTVGELVAQRPSRGRVFERYGIDYCCGGNESLENSCASKKVDVQSVLKALSENDQCTTPAETQEVDWTKASLTELVDHIQSTHHAYLKHELPRLSALTNKVAAVHHVRHPEVIEVRDRFNAMRGELESHCQKEEDQLFPACRKLDQHGQKREKLELAQQIQQLEDEHESAGAALAQLRALTHDYHVPADGCNTYRAMLDGLRDLELDLHSHINKENYALYPKVRAVETKCSSATS